MTPMTPMTPIKNIHSNEFSYLAIRNFNKGPYGIQMNIIE